MDAEKVAGMIDHTILGPDATKEDIVKKCQEAIEYKFASVCVNPSFVKLVKQELSGSPVKVCTVIGFPLGANTTETKSFATRDAVDAGADEIDMVINLGAIKSKAWEIVQDDIAAVVQAAGDKIVKVIIETCYLTEEEKKKACQVAKEAGADFVKTSTGFGTAGATVEDVKLMKEVVGDDLEVKASGGVRSMADAQDMIEAGATRIGASSGVKIVTGEEANTDY
ncbi:deoxyribose-phosphate aldolase [Halobacteroides halobius DSM 5150]|uniref:Deoxyribose-phosphate aldolase n=1 Tax=Halobacteroides halobius (strain ATCC 35273 / DSM 5150 / MD-1) TaxID=748449 RepID=L0KAQ3_HALHC|nr:deoxyribose-phosphate aldolase [Halobacteroides halobius]AGB42096.1 deoxyribose-phosphate aldolase [Halobacteroides halobius DSM 5150]